MKRCRENVASLQSSGGNILRRILAIGLWKETPQMYRAAHVRSTLDSGSLQMCAQDEIHDNTDCISHADALAPDIANRLFNAAQKSFGKGRGFSSYVRRFNRAVHSLPALPLFSACGVSDCAHVVVGKTGSTTHGTYYAAFNPSQFNQSRVTLTFPAASVKDLLTQTMHASSTLHIGMYPGEVRTFLVR